MIDLKQAMDVAVQAAKKAGEYISQGFETDIDFSIKTDLSDRVTQVDLDAQRAIIKILTEHFPECSILAEEEGVGGVNDTSEYRWVIDPLDGTANFTQKLPNVGVSIALQQNGESVVGVLFFPVLNDCYTAIKGEGAFLNGKQIHIQECEKMIDAYIAEVFSDRMHRGKDIQYPPCTAFRKFGSAVTSLAYLARGCIHGVALQCCLWDVAAAEIIIREAGGKLEYWWEDEGNERGTLTCVAAAPKIFDAVKEYAETQYSLGQHR